MSRTLFAGMAVLAALTLALPAAGAEEPRSPEARPASSPLKAIFEQSDADGDGKLDYEEFEAALQRLRSRRGAGGAKAPRKGAPGAGPKAGGPGKGGPPPLVQVLRRADEDQDGNVTAEEFKKVFPDAPAERFKTLDHDGDGVLTRADAPPRPPRGPGQPGGGKELRELLKKADADQNGEVTYAELKALRPEFTEDVFKRLDTNGDGAISKADRPPKRGKGQGGDAKARQEMQERMRKADKDGDKRLSFEEAQEAFPHMTEERFKERDRNGDGYLDKADRKQGTP